MKAPENIPTSLNETAAKSGQILIRNFRLQIRRDSHHGLGIDLVCVR